MKSTRIVLTIAGVLAMTAVWAQPKTDSPTPPQGGGSTESVTTRTAETTQPVKTTSSTQTQATLNSNPRQTPYSALPEQQPAKTTEITKSTETTQSTQTTAPRSASPLSEGVGGVGVHVGDTIVIRRDNPRYMTGERISTWVYDVMHTVRQVDSKYHPNGILVDGINSWVSPEVVEKKGTQTQSPDSPPTPSERGLNRVCPRATCHCHHRACTSNGIHASNGDNGIYAKYAIYATYGDYTRYGTYVRHRDIPL